MGLVDDFERRLERAVEGAVSKAFGGDIEPAEIGRRLVREMQDGRSVSVGAVYVPNDYTVRLAEQDHSRFEGLMPTLSTEFIALLKHNAGQRRWRLPGAVDVRFTVDGSLKPGKLEVDALHLATPDWVEPPQDPRILVELASDRKIRLEAPECTLGRSSSCTVPIDDPNASRTHAQIEQREQDWWIVDLDSTNGTLVNGSRVKQRRLTPGDRITIGASEFEFREPEPDIT